MKYVTRIVKVQYKGEGKKGRNIIVKQKLRGKNGNSNRK